MIFSLLSHASFFLWLWQHRQLCSLRSMAGYTFKYPALKSFCPSRFEKLHPRLPIQDTRRQSSAVCKNISLENRIAVCAAHPALLPAIIKVSLYFFNDKASRCVNLVLCDTTSCQRSERNGKTSINITVSQVVRFFCVIHIWQVRGFCSLPLWFWESRGLPLSVVSKGRPFPCDYLLWPQRNCFSALSNQSAIKHYLSTVS